MYSVVSQLVDDVTDDVVVLMYRGPPSYLLAIMNSQ